jgi:hypothetical protein
LKHKEEINIVLITSWNEYHERTEIEPHYDATANVDPYYIYKLTKQFIAEYKKNDIPGYIYSFGYYVLALAGAFFIFGLIARFILRAMR